MHEFSDIVNQQQKKVDEFKRISLFKFLIHVWLTHLCLSTFASKSDKTHRLYLALPIFFKQNTGQLQLCDTILIDLFMQNRSHLRIYMCLDLFALMCPRTSCISTETRVYPFFLQWLLKFKDAFHECKMYVAVLMHEYIRDRRQSRQQWSKSDITVYSDLFHELCFNDVVCPIYTEVRQGHNDQDLCDYRMQWCIDINWRTVYLDQFRTLVYLRITSYYASQRFYLQPNGLSTISRIANVPTIIGLDCSTVCPLEVIGSIIGALTVFC